MAPSQTLTNDEYFKLRKVRVSSRAYSKYYSSNSRQVQFIHHSRTKRTLSVLKFPRKGLQSRRFRGDCVGRGLYCTISSLIESIYSFLYVTFVSSIAVEHVLLESCLGPLSYGMCMMWVYVFVCVLRRSRLMSFVIWVSLASAMWCVCYHCLCLGRLSFLVCGSKTSILSHRFMLRSARRRTDFDLIFRSFNSVAALTVLIRSELRIRWYEHFVIEVILVSRICWPLRRRPPGCPCQNIFCWSQCTDLIFRFSCDLYFVMVFVSYDLYFVMVFVEFSNSLWTANLVIWVLRHQVQSSFLTFVGPCVEVY